MNELAKLYCEETEYLLLGTIFNRDDIRSEVFSSLNESDFFIPRNRQLFQAMKTMFSISEHIEITSLAMRLKNEHVSLKDWIAVLMDLSTNATSSLDIRFYLEKVVTLSQQRKAIDIARKCQERCCEEELEREALNEVLEGTQQSLFLLKNSTINQKGRTLADIARQPDPDKNQSYMDEVKERQEYYKKHGEADSSKTGLKTGFRSLDRLLNGLGKGNVVIIAGRPGMGKTTFALNIAQKVVVESKLPIIFFSMEMKEKEIFEKVVSMESTISGDALKKGRLDDQESDNLGFALNTIEQIPFIINDQSSLTMNEIKDLSRRYIQNHGAKLIVIDYLQLISSPSSKKTENRNQEISAISRALKIMAKDLDVPVIALSQLSRKTEERKSGPLLSDLRDSGAIEQDADQVIFVDRDGERSDIIIAKNRHGETGKFALQFRGDISKFYEYAWDHRNQEAP
jgi:replicative DNA helicase